MCEFINLNKLTNLNRRRTNIIFFFFKDPRTSIKCYNCLLFDRLNKMDSWESR